MPATLRNESDLLARFLERYSIELTTRDLKLFADCASVLPQGSEVFIARFPRDDIHTMVHAAEAVRRAGHRPVPHIVASTIATQAELDNLLSMLSRQAGVDTALILGGDSEPVGEYSAALQLIESGTIEANGIRNVLLACYPEGHPRIPREILERSLVAKLNAAKARGASVQLVSQFVFEAEQIISMAKNLRERGIHEKLRVGVSGPAELSKLLKYALRCGVSTSLRAARNNRGLSQNMVHQQTPYSLLHEMATASFLCPELGISGAHFFTFGDPVSSARWAKKQVAQ